MCRLVWVRDVQVMGPGADRTTSHLTTTTSLPATATIAPAKPTPPTTPTTTAAAANAGGAAAAGPDGCKGQQQGGGRAAGSQGGAGTPEGGHGVVMELPTCPVCLERLDEHISGIVTTVSEGESE